LNLVFTSLLGMTNEYIVISLAVFGVGYSNVPCLQITRRAPRMPGSYAGHVSGFR